MKNLIYTTSNESSSVKGFSPFFFLKGKHKTNDALANNVQTSFNASGLLTPEASLKMSAGAIPNLYSVCRDLFNTFHTSRAPYSALQFLPVMQQVRALDPEQLKRFVKNRETRHVLVDNTLMKVVLIHWKPGKVSSVHGHPAGGCVFKVLHGKLEELRYSTDQKQRILASNGYKAGSIAYIDDRLGYHAVGNPFGTSAVSLHVYTPGSPNSVSKNIF